MMTDMTTQQKSKSLTLLGGIAAVFKGIWWLVMKIWGAFIWCLLLIPAKKDDKPMSFSGKIMMAVFIWGLAWFVGGFDLSGFLGDIPMIWNAFWDGRLVF